MKRQKKQYGWSILRKTAWLLNQMNDTRRGKSVQKAKHGVTFFERRLNLKIERFLPRRGHSIGHPKKSTGTCWTECRNGAVLEFFFHEFLYLFSMTTEPAKKKVPTILLFYSIRLALRETRRPVGFAESG